MLLTLTVSPNNGDGFTLVKKDMMVTAGAHRCLLVGGILWTHSRFCLSSVSVSIASQPKRQHKNNDKTVVLHPVAFAYIANHASRKSNLGVSGLNSGKNSYLMHNG